VSVVRVWIEINYRAFQWYQAHYKCKTVSETSQAMTRVLLRNLQQQSGIDLSRSPFSEPKGESDGDKEEDRDT